MAVLAVPLVGAGLGYAAFAGTAYAAVATQVGWAVGSMVYAYMSREDAEAPDPGELGYSGSSYGINIPRGNGTYPVIGNYIWAPDKTIVESSEGGKGFGGGVVVNNEYASFGVLLAEEEQSAVRRIWFDTELVYDISNGNENLIKKKGLNIKIHLGTSTQGKDSTIVAVEGAANVPAHRGYCYIVVEDLALADYGNRRPTVRAELVRVATPANELLDLGTTGGGDGFHYSEADDTILTFNSAGVDVVISKWDIVNNVIVETATVTDGPSTGWTAKADIDPVDGTIYSGWWSSGSYSQLISIDPLDWSYIEGNVYCPLCTGCLPGQDPWSFPYFTAPTKVVKLTNYVAACHGLVGSKALILWPEIRSCGYSVYVTATAVTDVVEDSDGNIWFCIPGGDEIAIIDQDDLSFVTHDVSALSPSITAPNEMQWHVPTQTMLVNTSGAALYRLSLTAGVLAVEASNTTDGWALLQDTNRYAKEETLWLSDSVTNYVEVDVETLTEQRSVPQAHGDNSLYDALSNAIWLVTGGHVRKLLLDRVPADSETLAATVSDISSSSISTDLIDVTGLTGNVRGFVRNKAETNRNAIRRLMISHHFTGVEVDGKVKFVMMGGSLIDTIPEDDLAAHEYGSNTPDQTLITRGQEISFPKRVEVTALSIAREYEVTTQGAGRQITPASDTRKVALSEVLTDDETAQLADVLLFLPRLERNLHEFSLSNKYLNLAPTDEVVLTKGSDTHRVRITEIDYGAPGILKCKGVSVDAAGLNSSAVGEGGSFPPTTIKNIQQTKPYLMDLPILSPFDNLDVPGFYAAGTSYTTDFGFNLYVAPAQDDIDGTNILYGSVEATAGFTTTLLPDTDIDTTFDDVSTVTVQLNDTIASVTDAQLLAGSNAFAFSTGEIAQAGTVVDNGNNNYTLSHMLRGRRGTEWAISEHVESEQVVLLEVDPVYNVKTSITTNGVLQYYRAVTLGLPITDSVPYPFTNTNNRLKPFSPVHPKVTDDGTDTTIGWTRRTRAFIEPEYKSIPLAETTEAYYVEIWGSPAGTLTGTALVRTLTTLTEESVYLEEQQIEDFGSKPSSFDIKVFQYSAPLTRGHPLEFNTSDVGDPFSISTDLSEFDLGVITSAADPDTLMYKGWQQIYSSGSTLTVESDGSGGQLITQVNTGNTNGAYAYNPAGTHGDVEILFEVRNTNQSTYTHGAFCRWINSDGLVLASLTGSGNLDVRLRYGGWSPIGSYAYGFGVENVWVRMRVIGDSIQVRAWNTSLGSEGTTWDVSETSVAGLASPYLTEGKIGIGSWGGSGTYKYENFAVAYNGATASF